MRIYGLEDGAEGNRNMIEFVSTTLILDLPEDEDLGIECTHRSLGMKPTNPNAAPRSVVVKFLHFQMKQCVLHKAWATKDLQFNGSRVALDHDYSNAVQCK